MTKSKRLHIHAGVILERHKPGWVTSTTDDQMLVNEIEKILGETLQGKSTDIVYKILANAVENGVQQSVTKKGKDAYDHAMGVI